MINLGYVALGLAPHTALRAGCPGFEQISPTTRFIQLLSAATRVKPMRNLDDHGRYVLELCSDLNWVQPLQIYASAVHGPHAVTDPLSFIYVQAQLWRAQVRPSTFIGVDRYLFDPSPAAARWRNLFNFVVIDYTDRTTYHPDKDFLELMTTRYLNMLGLQAVMLGESLTLAAPYARNNPGEKQWMTNWLLQRFKDLFGGDFAELRFV